MLAKFFVYYLSSSILFITIITKCINCAKDDKKDPVPKICHELPWVERQDWGARPSKLESLPFRPLPVQHVFIHHTDSMAGQCLNKTLCLAAVKQLQAHHMDQEGWDDIGYNDIIGGDGRIYMGRPWFTPGVQPLGLEDKSLTLALVGQYDNNEPTPAMLAVARMWLNCTQGLGVLAGDYQLHGHSDQSCTNSPGQRVYDTIKTWPQFQSGPLDTYQCPDSKKSGGSATKKPTKPTVTATTTTAKATTKATGAKSGGKVTTAKAAGAATTTKKASITTTTTTAKKASITTTKPKK
ncbi:peptidoglycan-recognition protein SC2-like [Oppia nitens]|uniref:peptidoglycan-recognition protein SC2-like n=1 Tax=Oppia nitens TaxID=1686743 RepID=UPI0023DAE19C|nr:peptidoglycan-recognition protein SC2-like [Oppia nitens]